MQDNRGTRAASSRTLPRVALVLLMASSFSLGVGVTTAAPAAADTLDAYWTAEVATPAEVQLRYTGPERSHPNYQVWRLVCVGGGTHDYASLPGPGWPYFGGAEQGTLLYSKAYAADNCGAGGAYERAERYISSTGQVQQTISLAPPVCTYEDRSGCSTWQNSAATFTEDADYFGDNDCFWKAHCLTWYRDVFDATPGPPFMQPKDAREWNFTVADRGNSTGMKDYLIGHTCANQGPVLPDEPQQSVEAIVGFRGATQAPVVGGYVRSLPVICPQGQYIWNFYALDPDDLSVELFWGYGAPGSATPTTQHPEQPPASDCNRDCVIVVEPGYEPAPEWEAIPLEEGPGTPAPTDGGAGCDVDITNPSSWLCGLVGIAKRILNAVVGILSFLKGLGSVLLSLFVPRPEVLADTWDGVADKWQNAVGGDIGTFLGDVLDPITSLASPSDSLSQAMYLSNASVEDCAGPLVTVPLPVGPDLSLRPLNVCNELAQTVLGYWMPAASAGIYLATLWGSYAAVMRALGIYSHVKAA
jgi:hypothetical protein